MMPPRRRLPRRAAVNGVRDPAREEVRPPVARSVGGQLHVPALVRHARDHEAHAGPVGEPAVDERQLGRLNLDEHGGQPGAEAAAAGVQFPWSVHSMT